MVTFTATVGEANWYYNWKLFLFILYCFPDAEGEAEETAGADEHVEAVTNGVDAVKLNGNAEASAQDGPEGNTSSIVKAG